MDLEHGITKYAATADLFLVLLAAIVIVKEGLGAHRLLTLVCRILNFVPAACSGCSKRGMVHTMLLV
jgi:hypothetical protein